MDKKPNPNLQLPHYKEKVIILQQNPQHNYGPPPLLPHRSPVLFLSRNRLAPMTSSPIQSRLLLTDNEKRDELMQCVNVVDIFGNDTMKVISIVV